MSFCFVLWETQGQIWVHRGILRELLFARSSGGGGEARGDSRHALSFNKKEVSETGLLEPVAVLRLFPNLGSSGIPGDLLAFGWFVAGRSLEKARTRRR